VAIAEHEANFCHATEELAKIEQLRLFGRAPARARCDLRSQGRASHDVATILDRAGIAVRAAHMRAALMTKLGLTASTRASFAAYNTHEEVEALARGLHRVLELSHDRRWTAACASDADAVVDGGQRVEAAFGETPEWTAISKRMLLRRSARFMIRKFLCNIYDLGLIYRHRRSAIPN